MEPDQYITWNVKYSYRSIMHYGDESGKEMKTIDTRYQHTIGGAPSAAPEDYLKLCSMYNCSQCMGQPFARANGSCTKSLSFPRRRKECSRLPGDSQEFRDTCCTWDSPYRRELPDQCKSGCTPSIHCDGSLVVDDPTFFHHNCCGLCGPKALAEWCADLSYDGIKMWRRHDMCVAESITVKEEGRDNVDVWCKN